jgi:hypothetical protein
MLLFATRTGYSDQAQMHVKGKVAKIEHVLYELKQEMTRSKECPLIITQFTKPGHKIVPNSNKIVAYGGN